MPKNIAIKVARAQKDMPQKGKITIKKIGEYKHHDNWADIREKVMGGGCRYFAADYECNRKG